MSQTTTNLRLEPFVRIQRAGCDVSVSNVREGGVAKFRLCLLRHGARVACGTVARNGKWAVREAEQRIRRGDVAPWSDTYSVLCSLADVAEELYGAEAA